MNEMPLDIGKIKLMLNYCLTVKGHKENPPIKKVCLKYCEHESAKLNSFGWILEEEALSRGTMNIELSPTVAVSTMSSWLFSLPQVDLKLQKLINDQNRVVTKGVMVTQYLQQNYTVDQ